MPEYVEVDFSGISITGQEPVGMGINGIEKGGGWTDRLGKRHSITTKTLEELRQKESGIPEQKLFLDFLKPECSPYHH